MIFLTQLIVSLCLLLLSPFPSPSLSQAADVTLTVGSGTGFVGSICYYPNNNKVDVSLNNLSHKVKEIKLEIKDVNNFLKLRNLDIPELIACDTTTRTEGFSCIVVEKGSGNAKVTLEGGLINEDTGPIFTLFYDVKEEAPGGEYRDLEPQALEYPYTYILGGTMEPYDDQLSAELIPGDFYFDNCASNQDCDYGEVCFDDVCDTGKCTYTFLYANVCGYFCEGDFCIYPDEGCQRIGYPCKDLLCDEVEDRCYCGADEQCVDEEFCNGEETCNIETGDCLNGVYPCSEPTPYCDEENDVCYDYNVTLDVGDGSGEILSSDNPVLIDLVNPDNKINAFQVDICEEGDDYLTITDCTTNPARVPAGMVCSYGVQPDGCDRVWLYKPYDPGNPLPLFVSEGTGWVVKAYYDVSGEASTGYKDLNPEGASGTGLYERDGSVFEHYSGNVYKTSGINEEPTSCLEWDGDELSGMMYKPSIEEVNNNAGSYYWEDNTLYIHPSDGSPAGDTYYIKYELYYILLKKGKFLIYCTSDEQCYDELYCNGNNNETCVDQACQPGIPPCPYFCCDEVGNSCDVPGDDGDCDGVFDDGGDHFCATGETDNCDDNCPEKANGPDGGTCICGNEGDPCTSDGECGACGFCSMNQEDTDNDSLGDVCDPSPYADLCQSYCNRCNYCFELQDAGRNTDIFDCYFGGYTTEVTCEYVAGCTWNAAKSICVNDMCMGDFNGDTKVKAQERNILMKETGRTDCPYEFDSNDLCQQYLQKYNCCLDLSENGSNLDIFDCYFGGYDTHEACEQAGCTWNAAKSICVNDMCMGDFNGDTKVKAQERNILMKETGRTDCPDCL